MAPLPVIPNAYLLFQHFTFANERAPLGCRFCVTTSTSTPVATIANEVAAAIAGNLLPELWSGIKMGLTEVTPLDGTSPVSSISTPSLGQAGGDSSSEVYTINTAYCITWRTGTRGRAHRGRSYLPGCTGAKAASEASGILSSGAVTGLSAAGNAYINQLLTLANPLHPQVLSLKLGAITAITSATCNPHMTSQRRRMEKVARH